MWRTASATVQSIPGMGRVQSLAGGRAEQRLAGRSRLEQVPSLHGSSSPTLSTAATGLTAAGS